MLEKLEWPVFLSLINDKTKRIHSIPKVENSQIISNSAIDFANNHGGTLILGFDINNVQLRGANFDSKWLSAVLNQINPVLNYELKEVIKNGKRVFIVDVAEGEQKPYQGSVQMDLVEEKVVPIFEPPQEKVKEIIPEFVTPNPVPVPTLETPEKISYTVVERGRRCLEYLDHHPDIANSKYRELNQVSHKTAHNELSDLVAKSILKQVGQGRTTKYVLAANYHEEEKAPDLFGDTIDMLLKKNSASTSKTDIRRSTTYNHMNDHINRQEDTFDFVSASSELEPDSDLE